MSTHPEPLPLTPLAELRDGTVTLDQFAARLGRTRQFVAAGIRRGELPGCLVGREYVIPALAVELFMRGQWRPAGLRVKPVRLSPKSFIRTYRRDDAA